LKTTLQFILTLILLFVTNKSFAQGSGNSLKLDGYDDYIECSTSNRGITSSVTAEAWVKTSSYVYHWVVGKYDRDAQGGYHLIIKDGKAAFAGRDGSGTYRNSGYSSVLVNDNQWHHLAGVCNNGIWQIYVDGVLQSQLNSGYNYTDLTSTAMMAIGKDFLANNENFNGQVDEIRVWKKALSEAEIRQNMCQKVLPTTNGLVGYYNLNEGTGSTIQDLSSSKINGSFRNMNASAVWVVSGAPIGDKSTYLYPSTWVGQQLSLINSSNNKLSVSSSSSELKGIHIYAVSSPPNTTLGITNPEQITDYFGTFKVGSSNATYTITGEQENSSCIRTIFQRSNNATNVWSKVNETNQPAFPTYSTNLYQTELALNTSSIGIPKIQGNNIFCFGSGTTLSINTTGSVLWNTGETSKSINVTSPGIYSVTVTINGCVFSDELTVSEIALPVVDLGEDRSICFGETVTLIAPKGPYTYKWSTGATTQMIPVSASGTYWVDVFNNGSCVQRDEVNVNVKPQPNFTLQQELSVCYGEVVTLDATIQNATYVWSNGQTSASIDVTAPTNLSVSITVDGCEYVRQVKVLSDECPNIPNIITPNRDGKNDTFVLKGIKVDAIDIQIYNRWGKSIYMSSGYDNAWAADGNNGGIYYYHIKSRQTQKEYKGWVEVIK
jgi:gliding motility-associated-like protein